MGHFKSALIQMRRTPYQTISAGVINSLTFFVATLFMMLAFFSSSLLGYFEGQPQITVYFTDAKTKEEILSLQKKLEKNSKIKSVDFISKEEALKIYQEDNKDDPLLLEMVTAQILPASLDIRTYQAEYLDEIAKLVKGESEIEDVVYQKDIVDRLISWTRSLRIVGIILLIILVIEALLIILTILGIRILNKRKEIKILQLIGASSSYIIAPFLIEGILYGLTGALVGWLLSLGLLLYQQQFLNVLLNGLGRLSLPYLPMITVWPLSASTMLIVLAAVSIFGILLGGLGSFIAVRRYLK